MANDYILEFEVQWNNVILYNVTPTFELLHGGISYNPPITAQLVDAGDHCDYLGVFTNPPTNADGVRLTWNAGDPADYAWANWAPGETASFNWLGITWAETHASDPNP